MIGKRKLLGSQEELLLIALKQFSFGATGYEVHEVMEERVQVSISIGSVYNAFKALERKGMVEQEDRETDNSGRKNRFYKITGLGEKALGEMEGLRIRAGLEVAK